MNSHAQADTLLGTALAPMDVSRSVSLVVVFSLVMAAAAQISIPIVPVPITAQTFVVLLSGALLGSRLGAAAMILYLVEGLCGLPFFALARSGPAVLFGPTGGYLVAFPAAAFITGAFAEHGWDKRFGTAVAAMAIGSVVILLAGWAWFSLITHTPPLAAFKLSVAPHLIGDVIKILLAAAALPLGWQLLKRKDSR